MISQYAQIYVRFQFHPISRYIIKTYLFTISKVFVRALFRFPFGNTCRIWLHGWRARACGLGAEEHDRLLKCRDKRRYVIVPKGGEKNRIITSDCMFINSLVSRMDVSNLVKPPGSIAVLFFELIPVFWQTKNVSYNMCRGLHCQTHGVYFFGLVIHRMADSGGCFQSTSFSVPFEGLFAEHTHGSRKALTVHPYLQWINLANADV